MSFVHLHVHTQYSVLDATASVAGLAAAAKAHGAPALAMTDHSNLHGAVSFYNACKGAGIKPVFGCELNIAAAPIDERVRKMHHIVLIARNDEGWRNLQRLVSFASLRVPQAAVARLDHATLAQHSKGLIALSGCLGGEIPHALLRDKQDEALEAADRYKQIFEPGCFFIECQSAGLQEHKIALPRLLELAKRLDLPAVASNDVHYVNESDAHAHEVLMCIGLGTQAHVDARWLPTTGYDFASPEEMRRRFAGFEQLCDATLEIAQMCDVKLQLGKTFLPTFKVPEGETLPGHFARLAREGLTRRFEEKRTRGEPYDEATYRARLELEIGVITTMDFPGYFLIVADFINWAKDHDIPVGPGRGSGAGSLVAWSLRITDLDPLPYNLLFERFLNPERVSMPDFDVDFCMNRRGEVIEYVTQKYGTYNVGQIATFGTLKAKGALRDVGRVQGLGFADVDKVAKLVPDGAESLQDALKMEPRLRAATGEDDRVKALVDTATLLEGAVRNVGMHAAGVVISEEPLWEYVPVLRGQNNEIVTQFAKDEVEKAGLVKFDFLGLKTLTMIHDAVKLVNKQKQPGETPLELSLLTYDDKKTYEIISRGDTAGVFQMESSGFTEMVKKMRPSCFEDVVAAGALYRPGPLGSGMDGVFVRRKHGQEKVVYPHASLEPVLKDTYGVIVYQEQVMQISQVLAGYSLGKADLLRRAMGKKKPEIMALERVPFVQGAVDRNVDEKVANEIFDLMAQFAEYGFNKSHSAAYGLVTYYTAYLKAHHPTEFWAALMTSEQSDTDKVVQYIGGARAAGQKVLPPDVNLSELSFSVAQGAIRFGLGAVKGLGEGAIEAILEARSAEGAFTSLFDFVTRTDPRKVNKRVLEALVRCGAFDGFGERRDVLMANLDRAIERAQAAARERESGQVSLFDLTGMGSSTKAEEKYLPASEPWDERTKLAFEKEALGFYVSGHPLDEYARDMKRFGATPVADLRRHVDERGGVLVAGVIAAYRDRITKAGKRMGFATIEDHSGQVEVTCFAKTLEAVETLLKGDKPLLLRVTVQRDERGDEGALRFLLDSAQLLATARQDMTRYVVLRLDASAVTADRLKSVKALLQQFPGSADVLVRVGYPGLGDVLIQSDPSNRIEPSDAFVSQAERLLGSGVVAFGV